MLSKKYDHSVVEQSKYEIWKERGYFLSGDKCKTPFTMTLPPPNVTGNLHLGHAWDVSIQDVLARYKRMDGYDVLWVPGTDHAAIATEAKVVNKLKQQGVDKYKLGRDKFLEECWAWTREYSGNIHKEWAKMGMSIDYSKERFTLDEVSFEAVNKAFIEMYNNGLIYRGKKIINWDPEARTALSNEEVIYKDVEGAFYHIKYYIEDTEDYIDVATTRPETLFGDTAVAVNPKDERYIDLIGRNVIVPIVNRSVKVVADNHAEIDKGTGAVKITPAHDPNDFEVGNRHSLERIVIMDETAHMINVPEEFMNLDRFEARKKVVKTLEENNLLIDIEKITHSVGFSERTDAMVEPYLSEQWFVKMRDLADSVINTQMDKENKVNFFPKRFEKIINQKAEECYDWCISRQLWWGIRIPIWYKDDKIVASVKSPGEGYVQDPDVLDTWFSSALWPFSTLKWASDDELYKRYFPTSFLTAGYDIIFFWVFRMMFQSLNLTKVMPFKDCYVHGLIRAKDGRKMSKSLGNGVTPTEMIDKYGCDALRYYLTTTTAIGLDLRFDEEKLSSTWNFINKIWNASRFTLMNIESLKKTFLNDLKLEDKWILNRYNETLKVVRKNMDKYEFQNVSAELERFIWNDFCSSYIELSKNKDDETTKSVLFIVLDGILKMLHPFMPFVTEEIYQKLPIKDAESIMISEYPKVNKKYSFKEESEVVSNVLDDIVNIRNLKATNKITKDAKIKIKVLNEETLAIYTSQLKILNENIVDDDLDINKVNYKSKNIDITYFFEGSKEDENKKEEEIKKLKESIERREKLLSNENYVNKAPKEIVDLDKKKLKEEKEKLELLMK